MIDLLQTAKVVSAASCVPSYIFSWVAAAFVVASRSLLPAGLPVVGVNISLNK